MQAPSQETIKKRLSLSPVHIKFKKNPSGFATSLQEHSWATPLFWPSMCLPACLQASGCRPKPLRCLFALESSANHIVPFLPLCCCSAASTLWLFSPVPQPYLAGVKRHRGTWKSKKEETWEQRAGLVAGMHLEVTPHAKFSCVWGGRMWGWFVVCSRSRPNELRAICMPVCLSENARLFRSSINPA